MKEEQMKFKVIDDQGNEIECEVLFTLNLMKQTKTI